MGTRPISNQSGLEKQRTSNILFHPPTSVQVYILSTKIAPELKPEGNKSYKIAMLNQCSHMKYLMNIE